MRKMTIAMLLLTSLICCSSCGESNSPIVESKPIEEDSNNDNNNNNNNNNNNSGMDSSELKTSGFTLNGVSWNMVLVEGGTFTMGHNNRQANERPEHQVTLTSYLIGETEVTQPLWTEVMGSNPSYRKGSNYPVENVTWKRCHDFVDRLNERMHAEKLISDDWNFHMLSEAQWEYAAKGGNQSKGFIYSGSDNLHEVAWNMDDDGRISHPVKRKMPNELGLYDMSGNVYEWVADYFSEYTAEAQTNPCNLTKINSSRQVIKRGGSFWYNDSFRYTCTYRYAYYEEVTDESIGLRICLYPDASATGISSVKTNIVENEATSYTLTDK